MKNLVRYTGLIGIFMFTAIPDRLRRLMHHQKDEPDIAGDYGTYDNEAVGGVRVGYAKIRQKGRRVTLTVTRQINRRGERQRKETVFSYDGRFQSGVLTALFHDDSASYRAGAIVLNFEQSSDKLVGKTMYYDGSNGVVSHYFDLRRSQH